MIKLHPSIKNRNTLKTYDELTELDTEFGFMKRKLQNNDDLF